MPIDLDNFEDEIKEMEAAAAKKPDAADDAKKARDDDAKGGDDGRSVDDNEAGDEQNADNKGGKEGDEAAAAAKAKNPAHERVANKKKNDEIIARNRELELEIARLKGVQEGAKPKEEAVKEEEEPDPILKPDAWKAWNKKQIEKEHEPVRKEVKALTDRLAEQQAEKDWQEIDQNMSEANPVYASSMKYLREKIVAHLKETTNGTDAEIRRAAKSAELNYVKQLAAAKIDVSAAFIGEAIQSGHNPFAEQEKKADNPKTDKKEVQHHKKNSGTVADVPTGGGKGRLSAKDVAEMSTMGDIFKLGKLKDSDWDQMAKEASRR